MKIFISSNCATMGYYNFCSMMFPNWDVRSAIHTQASKWVENKNTLFIDFLEGVDLVIAAPLVLKLISKYIKKNAKIVEVPNFIFMGHQPDCFWLKDVRSPLGVGVIHSRIVAAAFAIGKNEKEVLDLFSNQHFQELGYYSNLKGSIHTLINTFSNSDIDISRSIEVWLSTGDFMYTPNHPKSFVLFDILHDALMGTSFGDELIRDDILKNRREFPDYLSKSIIWPVYHELANEFELKDYRSSWRTVLGNGSGHEFGVEEMIARSYREYENTPNIEDKVERSLGGSQEIAKYGNLPELWISQERIVFFKSHFGFMIFQTIGNETREKMYDCIYG